MRIDLRKHGASVARCLCKLWRAPSGQHRLANSLVLRALSHGLTEVAAGRSGWDYICVNLADTDGRSAYYFGCNDRKVYDVIKRILRLGDRAIDIGANYGTLTLLMARCVGHHGLIHAYEPHPDVSKLLIKSIAANGFTHVVPHQLALSDHDGEQPLHIVPGSSGAGSLSSGSNCNFVAVPVADANAELNRVGHVRLLKIDVEGHELTILTAAREYLSKIGPDYLLFEYNYSKSDFWTAPLPSLLRSLGYSRIYEIPRCFFRTSLRLLQGHDVVDSHTANFLAVRDGVTPQDIRCV